jgi:hypothetical protein
MEVGAVMPVPTVVMWMGTPAVPAAALSVTVQLPADPAASDVGEQVKLVRDCPKARAPMDDRNKAVVGKWSAANIFIVLISLSKAFVQALFPIAVTASLNSMEMHIREIRTIVYVLYVLGLC